MATNVKFKRSAIEGKRPSISQLELGELALNTNDGRVFTRKYNVGIGSTVTLLNVWTENIGGGAYYTDGNIGIGTTNPEYTLDVAGDINFTGTFYQGGSQFIASSQWDATGSDIYRLSKVGINTSIVSSTLTVNGDVSISGVVTATTFVGAVSGTATTTTNIPNLTGDITSANTVTTLATVNSNVGTFGGTGAIPVVTVNGKGLVTGISTVATNNGTLTLATSGTGISGSASFTANQSGASTFTVTSNATNVNTNNAIVARDGSGNFSAGTITASLTGTATSTTNIPNLTGAITSNNTTTVLGSFTSANLATALTDETGSGANVFATSPTLVTPVLGAASATNINVSGSVTATTFVGNLIGNINSSGVNTATTLSGTNLTYTTGVITNISGTNISCSGISTFLGNVNIGGTVSIGTAIDIVPYDNLNNGTLSFEGSAGQLFSITNNLTSGSIFSVNDVSGIPSIDVDANGTIQLAPYGGNIGLGTTNPISKLHIIGNALVSGIITATTFVGALTGTATSTTNIPNLTGDITSVNSVTSIATGVIVDADINASAGIVDTKLATIATALKVSNSATTATNANTASTIVARDGSGNFSAGTITANLTGTASNVTTNANLTGHITSVGNATVLGSFTSANLATALTDETGTGALVFATSPTLVTPVLGAASATSITASGAITANSYNVGADVGISTTRTTVATTAATTIDSFAIATFRSARVQVQITQSTDYQASDILVIHDGTNASIVEYGSIATNDYLGTFSASVSGGDCLLRINMSSATSSTVKVLSQRITI